MSNIETIQVSRRVLRCVTSTTAYIKYDRRILLWAKDLMLLRANKADGISFGFRGEHGLIEEFIPASKILQAVDERVGEFFPYKETYFIAINMADLSF